MKNNNEKRKISIFMLTISSIVFQLNGQGDWTLRDPLPTNANLNTVIYANGAYIAAGVCDNIFVSSDGISWQSRPTMIDKNSFNDLTWGNGMYAAASYNGRLFTSPDCITWTKQNTSTTVDLWGITWGNNLFVAVGDSGKILVSSDGSEWSNYGIDSITYCLNKVIWSDGRFIAVGDSGTILSSSDGMEWTDRSCDSIQDFLCGIGWGNNVFLVISVWGKMYTSPDGIAWTQKYYGPDSAVIWPLRSVAWGDNKFIVCGGDGGRVKVIISENGIEWNVYDYPISPRINSLSWGNGQFIAVGTSGAICTSPDGKNWTCQTSRLRYKKISSIVYGKGVYIVVGEDGIIASSPDGIGWTISNSGTNHTLRSVAAGDSMFVAVGDSGAIVSSLDGISWAKQESGTLANLVAVAGDKRTFVAISDSAAALVSQDEAIWNKKLQGSIYDHFQFIACGNNKFIVLSSNSDPLGPMNGRRICFSSSDGNTWVSVGILWETYAYITALAGGKNRFVFFAYDEMLTMHVCFASYSIDGTTWTSSWSKTGASYSYAPVVWQNNEFIAISRGGMLTSPDGITWSQRSLKGIVPYSLTFGKDLFVGLGTDNFGINGIYTSPVTSDTTRNIKRSINKYQPGYSIVNNTIRYTLEISLFVSISLCDLKGRIIKYLVNSTQQSGSHTILISSVPNGVYLIRFNSGKTAEAHTVVVMAK
jgi:hypothetical protein